jgi:uncharacterized protein
MSGPPHRPPTARTERDSHPDSPCILNCTLDLDDRCLGCGRSLDQIVRWSLMSKDEQWAVIDELAARQPD